MPPPRDAGASQAGPSTAGVTDALFGTRSHTQGAKLQLPRKVPLRIEPKTYFANERTFLAWLHMAVTLGGVATALVGFSTNDEAKQGGSKVPQPISRSTTDLITIMLLPLSIIMVLYAVLTFYFRSKYLEKKQIGFFRDWIGPAVIATLVMTFLVVLLLVSAVQIWIHHRR